MTATMTTLTFVLISLLHFSHGIPIRTDPTVTSIIDAMIKDQKWDDLCKLQGQIAMEMDDEKRPTFDVTLEYMENLLIEKKYDCPTLVITTVVKTSTTTEAMPMEMEYVDKYENSNSTEANGPGRSLCDDYEIDYNQPRNKREAGWNDCQLQFFYGDHYTGKVTTIGLDDIPLNLRQGNRIKSFRNVGKCCWLVRTKSSKPRKINPGAEKKILPKRFQYKLNVSQC